MIGLLFIALGLYTLGLVFAGFLIGEVYREIDADGDPQPPLWKSILATLAVLAWPVVAVALMGAFAYALLTDTHTEDPVARELREKEEDHE